MTLDHARQAMRTAIKMALPYGMVRAVQMSRERRQLLAVLDQASGTLTRLAGQVDALEAERRRRDELARAASEADAAALAARLETEREAFGRNEIVVNGKRIHSRAEAPLIDFQIDGHDNAILIHPPTGPGTLHVATRPGTVGCRLEFGAANRIASNVFVTFFESGGKCARESIVSIGDGNWFNGNVHVLAGISPSTVVRIGSENLFADNIQIVGAVEHLTYNVASMARESIEHGVRIEDRVWVCKDVLIYNKSEIASDNVVAARAVTNKRFDESNTIIAGSPAKVTKRGIRWHLNTTDDYLSGVGPLEASRPSATT
ncbi:hypothetical protein QTH97_28230 [Variovorax sp. J22R24]|uniref:hypothetical protein n=1 Tax=Variovorax gracilis TaxID=3053502 RepID=UPI0025780EFE|nr:hypothetical protein [Variovorax sp. J22R24]MDM0108861.1 hypothetical protein [Variovorax sp. J22R24]